MIVARVLVLAVVPLGCTALNPAFDPGSDESGTSAAAGSTTEPVEPSQTSEPLPTSSTSEPEPESTTGPSDGTSSTLTEGTEGTDDHGGESTEGLPACSSTCEGVCIEGLCRPGRLVFVSRDGFIGSVGGLRAADAFCQTAAETAGHVGQFQAWLSDTNGWPAKRMTLDGGPFLRPDGVEVALDWDDLTDGMLAAPIALDEYGDPGPESFVCSGHEVWSNTTPAGMAASMGTCGDWMAADLSGTSEVGRWDQTGEQWTWSDCGLVSCSTLLPVYCVQQ